MKFASILLIFSFPFIATTADVFITVPNDLRFVSGNSSTWPFAYEQLGITSRRYQEVFEAAQFSAIGMEGGIIKQLYFRQHGPGVERTIANVQIEFAITSKSTDSLSPVFSENASLPAQLVYGPSSLQVSTLDAAPWAIITLTQPYFYNPASGNLLMDIKTYWGGGSPDDPRPIPQLDAHEMVGDSIAAVMANDVNATSGFLTTRGLVTGFLVEPIPEPSTWVLLGLGLFGIWRFLRRRT